MCLFSVDLPDDLPSLTPAPSKKSKENRVRFEDQDTEAVLDKHDTHISAVLSRIVVSIYCTSSLVMHARVKKIHKLNSLDLMCFDVFRLNETYLIISQPFTFYI